MNSNPQRVIDGPKRVESSAPTRSDKQNLTKIARAMIAEQANLL